MRHQAFAFVILLASSVGCNGNLFGRNSDGDSAEELAGPEGTGGFSTLTLRRLSNFEYQRSVRDLVGAAVPTLPPFNLELDAKADNFDHYASIGLVTQAHLDKYEVAATQVAELAFASAESKQALMGCDLEQDAEGCLPQFIERFGRRAYRRPLAAEEAEGLLALAQASAEDGSQGARTAFEAMLISPHFLFRPELGAPVEETPDVYRLTGFEVATRLSYMLSASAPDDELLDAAANGELSNPEGVEAHAQRMMSQPQAKEALRHFYNQWLHLDTLTQITRSEEEFPEWNEALPLVMAEETQRFVDELIFDPQADMLNLLGANYSYINAELADLYGVAAPAAGEWAKVTFAPGDERRGLLTQASLLTVTSRDDETVPLYRGKFVREAILCDDVPPPPPGAAAAELPNLGEDATIREQFAAHAENPSCKGCHELMDPIGFGLEGYNPIGKRRTEYENGDTIDVAGEVIGIENPNFNGAVELSERLRGATAFAQCIVKQVFRFAFGKRETAEDEASITVLNGHFGEQQHQFSALLTRLVRSDAFRFAKLSTEIPAGEP